MINSDIQDSAVGLPITAYLQSKHGLEAFKSRSSLKDPAIDIEAKFLAIDKRIESLKIPALQISTLESRVKSNNKLTVSNSDEIKKSNQDIAILKSRLDSCSSEMDGLSLGKKESEQELQDLKRGTKRKWDEIHQFSQDVDSHLDSFTTQLTDLEISVHDLSLQIKEIQNHQKKQCGSWLKSAAVGASAAIVVVAGVILSPEW